MRRASAAGGRGVAVAMLLLIVLAGCNLAPAPTPTPPLIPTLTDIPPLPPLPTPEDLLIVTAPPAPRSILFLGDSITQGWNVAALYPGAVNGGQTGDTSGQVLARYRSNYAGLTFDAAVIHVGINDITSGVGDQALRDNLTALANALHNAAGRIVIGALLPVGAANYGPDVTRRIAGMNDWLREFAASRGYRFVDYYAAMQRGDGYAIDAYFQDGLHPSSAGYRVMASVLADALR